MAPCREKEREREGKRENERKTGSKRERGGCKEGKRKRKIEDREKENGWVKGIARGRKEAVGGSGSLEIKVLFS